MNPDKKQQIVDTGLELLKNGLVARTWGNISARLDKNNFFISPSGIAYKDITVDMISTVNISNGTYIGHRPSSEYKVHLASYQNNPNKNYIIHTHQDFATAISLNAKAYENVDGTLDLPLTGKEKAVLGTIKAAEYALPGSDELRDNVFAVGSADVIFMKHHGILLLGENKTDSMEKAIVLEQASRRIIEEQLTKELVDAVYADDFLTSDIWKSDEIKSGFRAQLDDMAQILGKELKVKDTFTPNEKASITNINNSSLRTKIVKVYIDKEKGLNIDNDFADKDALICLLRKAALCRLYTASVNAMADLSDEDCEIMHNMYVTDYSRRINCVN